MALLKNLQDKYSKERNNRASLFEDPVAGSDAESAQDQQPAKMRTKPRKQQPVTALHHSKAALLVPVLILLLALVLIPLTLLQSKAGSLVTIVFLALLAGWHCFAVIRNRKTKSVLADEQLPVTDQQLAARNRLLADRLEQLEDQTWEIRESEEIHRSLAEAFGDIVLHRNLAGDIVFSNKPFQDLFGKEGKLPFPPTQHEDGTVGDIKPSTADVQLDTRLGKRWFSWADLKFRDPVTGEIGTRTVARDITGRKEHEERLKQAVQKEKLASEAKSRFLAMVSHEIRTPLNGVIGMAKLLEDTSLEPSQRSYVDAISTSGTTLLSLIEDLLDTSRIEAGQLVLTKRETSLVRLVESVADLVAPRAREKGLAIATYVDPDLPADFETDPERLRQVLVNLTGNAVKFTKTGGIAIEVLAGDGKGTNKTEKSFISFRIIDSGPGLAVEDQERIFEEFVQTDEGATRAHGGAGLGLAISQQIVELMGGKIVVSSKPGRGATFSFSLPCDAVQHNQRDILDGIEDAASVALILPRSPARAAIVRNIRALGYRPSTFDSMTTFKAVANGTPQFAAIIVPQGNGADWELNAGEIAGFNSAAPRLVILGDLNATHSASDTVLQNGAGWLTWPVRRSTLEKVLMGEAKDCGSGKQPETCPLAKPARSLKVLVAEDNPINAMLINSLLCKMGHQVTLVEDGAAAVATWQKNPFDLILLDLHMPLMDGLQVLSTIRRQEEVADVKVTPTYILTADGQEKVRKKVISAGATGCLTKPLDFDAVTAILEKRLSAQDLVESTENH